MIETSALLSYTDTLLNSNSIKDYCPNGLQVQGTNHIQTIIGGVSASQALIEQAIEQQADALLVHHGYFWNNEPPCIVGMKYRRIAALIQNHINLIVYHLPLDAHPELGNNALLGKALGIQNVQVHPDNPYLWYGNIVESPIQAFIERAEQAVQRTPLHLSGGNRSVQKIGWCTGGAQDMIEQAAALGCDAFISGECSERTTHLAVELGIDYLSCGHHNTETFGVQALGMHLAEHFEIDFHFINIPNPV